LNLNLSNRRALVLGASRGLGAAIARGLLAEGATVYGAARDLAAIEGWRSRLEATQAERFHGLHLDLASPDSVASAAQAALQDGPVDILVNNTGGPPPCGAVVADAAQWSSQFQQMAIALFTLTGRLLPSMLARKWGRILTIASSGVQQPIPNLALSNTIRSSIVGWSKTLAAEVAAQGVTVNIVIPGRIHTDRVDSWIVLPPPSSARVSRRLRQLPQARYLLDATARRRSLPTSSLFWPVIEPPMSPARASGSMAAWSARFEVTRGAHPGRQSQLLGRGHGAHRGLRSCAAAGRVRSRSMS